jgi:hypothetical protein
MSELSTRHRAAPRFFYRASRPKILAPRYAAPRAHGAARGGAAARRLFKKKFTKKKGRVSFKQES